MTTATARIEPLEAPFEAPVGELLAQMMPAGMAPIALFRTLVKNMPMARAAWQLGAYELGRDLSLDRRTREIVIDRTCVRLGCEYEWSVHVAHFAERVGLTPEQLSSLTHGTSADPCWESARERLIIDTVDALTGDGDIPDSLWDALCASLSEAEILDLVVMTGWYHAICFVARSTRLPLEPGGPTFASIPAPGAA